MLAAIEAAGDQGLRPDEAAAKAGTSLYAARVLLEACYSLDLLELEGRNYRLSSSGYVLLHDPEVRVNMDFTQDVCYLGAFKLDAALEQGKPAGLSVFGNWPTIYAGLTQLPPKVLESWFAFDHAYSSAVFPHALPVIHSKPVKRLLDVGGNTGKFAVENFKFNPSVEVTILDHPGQLELAKQNAKDHGFEGRLQGVAMDLLDHSKPFPTGFDAVWMSQFLDCFGEGDILQLLKRGKAALAPGGRLHVLETYWDRQPHLAARDAVIATSLYFTCMANGDSRMYHSDDLRRLIAEAGLKVVEDHQFNYHTLFCCEAA
jgi:ubiquinone/menaquinone biosynthesis C-methylase UbiE